jgi:hypothetical protein
MVMELSLPHQSGVEQTGQGLSETERQFIRCKCEELHDALAGP